MAVTRQFMANSVTNSSQLASHPSPSMQFLVTLIAIKRIEMTIGKLSTAIKIVLLLALAAMLERRVKEEANPKEVKRIVVAKMD